MINDANDWIFLAVASSLVCMCQLLEPTRSSCQPHAHINPQYTYMMVKILSCSGESALGAVADTIFSGTWAAAMVAILDIEEAVEGVETDLGVLATWVAVVVAVVVEVAAFLTFLVVDDAELDTGLELLVYLVSFSIAFVGVVLILVCEDLLPSLLLLLLVVACRFVGGLLILDLLSEASWSDLRFVSLPDDSRSLSDLSVRLVLVDAVSFSGRDDSRSDRSVSFSGRDDSRSDRNASLSERELALTAVIEARMPSFSVRLDSLSKRAAGDRRRWLDSELAWRLAAGGGDRRLLLSERWLLLTGERDRLLRWLRSLRLELALSSRWRSRSFSRSRLDFSSSRRLLVVVVAELEAWVGVDAATAAVDNFRKVDPGAVDRSVPLPSSSMPVWLARDFVRIGDGDGLIVSPSSSSVSCDESDDLLMLLLRLGIFVDLKNSADTELGYACFSDLTVAASSSLSSLILEGCLLFAVVDVRIGAWLWSLCDFFLILDLPTDFVDRSEGGNGVVLVVMGVVLLGCVEVFAWFSRIWSD